MKKYIFTIFLIFSWPATLLAEPQTHNGFFFQIYHSGFFNLVDGEITSDSTSGSDSSYEEDEGDKYNYGIKLGGAPNPNWVIHINFATMIIS